MPYSKNRCQRLPKEAHNAQKINNNHIEAGRWGKLSLEAWDTAAPLHIPLKAWQVC
jgi:hypothetical protein